MLAVEDRPLVYMEDVGRHNAVDKIAGWMFREKVEAADKIFYTTGRLTSEMVLKTVRMGIPVLVSRSGFTAWGVELARKANLTLIGRARGKRFTALAGLDRIVFDQDLRYVEEESSKHRRKAAMHERSEDFRPRPRRRACAPHGRRRQGADRDRRPTILSRVLATFAPQCEAVILNANGDPKRFASFGLPVVSDDIPDFAGPLAGILAGLDWMAAHRPDLRMDGERAGRLPVSAVRSGGAAACSARAAGTPLACAKSGDWRHPVVGLWNVSLRDDLRHALIDEDLHKIEIWTGASRHRDRGMARPAGRSVLQRQYAGRTRARERDRRNLQPVRTA